MKKPNIEYPCEWAYTIIGTDEVLMREAIREIFCDRDHHLSFSKKSESGKYISLNAKVNVLSEDDRNKIYSMLCKCPTVKTVL
jgi:putative lipoic acid-binding regulatory protein